MPQKHRLLITIGGPTAVGKTALTAQLAADFSSVVISCDSRQIYREMSIGTAVPEPEHLTKTQHYFIQTHSIHQPLNANDFGTLARQQLSELFRHYQIVFMTGGSGLYIDAVLKGIDDIPSPDQSIRAQIQSKIDQGLIEELQQELKSVDPEYFSKIDIQNPRRLLRGLEVFYTCGIPLSAFLGKDKHRPFYSALIVLEMQRDLLYHRINQRVDKMVESGIVDEALQLYPHKNLQALQTVGYQELFEFFDHKISLEEAITKIKNNTRQFARKQDNWFRRYDEAFRFQWNNYSGIKKLISTMIENFPRA